MLIQTLIWSLQTLKVRPPTEIALQDSSDDFSPSPQTSPTPQPRHLPFNRTIPQPRLRPPQPPSPVPPFSTRPSDPADLLSTLDISSLPLSKDASTLDWTPSTHQTTFSQPYVHQPSLFSSGRGTLPPAPGTSFPVTRGSTKGENINWFKSTLQYSLPQKKDPSDEADGRAGRDIEFREQRLWPQQESTGLESLMGQALRLDDEPTLVRAVKRIKRNMARDERVREGYTSLAVSGFAVLLGLLGWGVGWMKVAVCLALLHVGIGRLMFGRGVVGWVEGIMAIVLGLTVGVPLTGIEVPYSRFILRLYSPPIQMLLHTASTALLLISLARDITAIITLRLDQIRQAKRDEEQRQQKMRGIFYTPVKPGKGSSSVARSVSTQDIP